MNREQAKIKEFDDLATRASYHYADDSCREWDKADDCKQKAMAEGWAGHKSERMRDIYERKARLKRATK